jgi:hypothetical protein
MRAPGWFAAVLGLALSRGAVAGPETVDVSSYRGELVVLSDDDGTVYIVRPRSDTASSGPVFVGDGKVFYEQYLRGSSRDGTQGTWGYTIWAPRVPGYDDAGLHLDKDRKYWLSCGIEKTVELRPYGKKEADRVLASAELRPRLFDRTPHLLARDDDGIYYYVDRDHDPRERSKTSVHEKRYQRGHRVFAGKKGAMKELPMTNVVADSAGEIYQTKRGDLRIVTSTDRTATWVRGKKKTALTLLEPGDNRYLVYRELGVYGFMGTACEDL